MFATTNGAWTRQTLIGLASSLGILVATVLPGAAQSPNMETVAPAPLPSDAIDPAAKSDILDMDIDQLGKVDVKVPSMDVEVTSVAKHESTVGRSPAAVFVISNEMIRRSGATSVPEVLRLAPGVNVARVNSYTWAISIRGAQGRFANKLLVLIDGRTVYNQYCSGVYWDAQDLLLEDVERIEIIRGPGGTLWGANAVNGVINVITKKAQDTQGALVQTGGGNLDKSISSVRVGGNNGQGLNWRIYGRHFERGHELHPTFDYDDWRMGHGGFRVDYDLDRHGQDTLTVLGDYYGGNVGNFGARMFPTPPYFEPYTEDEGVTGANLLWRWTHKFSDDSDYTIQMYYDRTFRDSYAFKQETTAFDVEFQHRFPLTDRQQCIWGLDSRQIHNRMPNSTFLVTMVPPADTYRLFSGFIQDEITLREDELFFTVGTKLENNSYTGFEVQPSARLLWAPDKKHAVWGAVSRAVRLPSRVERDSIFRYGPWFVADPPSTAFQQYNPYRDVKSETLMAYELGYREQTTERFAWDVALFFNVYEEMIGPRSGDRYVGPGYWIYPVIHDNAGRGHTYGFEWAAQWAVSDTWRLDGSYSFLRSYEWWAADAGSMGIEGYPRNQARLGAQWDLGNRWQADAGFRYVDTIVGQSIPDYFTMDLRLAWTPRRDLEVAVVGTNLLDQGHPEFNLVSAAYGAMDVRRTVFAQLTWRR
ncbi:MAG: TonB-dependent receptor [Pirellulales bacterium]|nr:TonB-dependent receptor [Pirellulales bacterium]